jgi:PAT family beta-lactamase induction signal transducer AmpG
LTAPETNTSKAEAWRWIPSLYFTQGVPYVIVMMVSVVMYKRLGISNTDIALYTSWLYLPWVIKPLWSPLVDLVRTKRWWVVAMQLLMGAGLAAVAFSFPLPGFFQISLAILWLMAFSSATHDIAADGFYLLALDDHQQSWFVGIRSTFYRFAMIAGQGLLVMLAGYVESVTGPEPVTFSVQSVAQSEVYSATPFSEQDESDTQLRLIPSITSANVPLRRWTVQQYDSVLHAVTQHNALAGFYGDAAQKKAQTEASISLKQQLTPANRQEVEEAEPYNAFERWLKNTFGPKVPEEERFRAPIVVVELGLSEARSSLSNELIVNLSRDEGSSSINLIEGERLQFGPNNAHQKAKIAVALDHQLRNATSASFIARSGNIRLAWSVTIGTVALSLMLLGLYHMLILPKPAVDTSRESQEGFFVDYLKTFAAFFKREKLGWVLAFLLLYRFGEAQLVKIAAPFLLDSTASGGLGLSTGEVGFIYGTVGVAMLTIGGILGGFLAARDGLKKWLWWMVIGINLPNAVYVLLAIVQPQEVWLVTLGVGIEQFGYGFGFAAYMLYCIYVAQGDYQTSHYAITTGFMALGMMIPGMFSGWLQELIGYPNFFMWVILATVPAFIVTAYIPLDSNFGKKDAKEGTSNG